MISLFQNEWLMLITGLVVGSIFGSFLNVCAHRIPMGKSIISPRSLCPNCDQPIPWINNIPFFTWFFQRGRARCCDFKIPIRYIGMEISSAIVFGYFFYQFSLHNDLGLTLSGCLLGWILLAVIVIDAENMIIPDRLSMGGALAGVIFSILFPSIHGYGMLLVPEGRIISGLESVIGLLIGSSLLFWIGVSAEKILGREALGMGDIKLLGCIGAFCGWQATIFVIFGGAFLGSLVSIPMLLIQSKKRKTSSVVTDEKEAMVFGREIPFGPYLALATILYIVFLKEWIDPWFVKSFFFNDLS